MMYLDGRNNVSKNISDYYVYEDGNWMHKTPIKLFINPILRKIQFFTNKPYVIASLTMFVGDVPCFIKYQIHRVEYVRK